MSSIDGSMRVGSHSDDLNTLVPWTEMFEELERMVIAFPGALSVLPEANGASLRQASKDGFALLRAKCGEMDPETCSSLWWLTQALKKFRGVSEIDPEERATQAIQGFVARNERAKNLRLPRWVAQRMRELLKYALPCPDDFPDGHFGPGAVAEHLNAVEKWRMVNRFRIDPRTGAWDPTRDAAHAQPQSDIARLCAVPKDITRDRLITVEPAENSFWQQALRDALLASVHQGPLRGTVMDMIHGGVPEERQRRRCLAGSATGHTTTLDLEDASDSISVKDVMDVFPAWVTYLIELSRSGRIAIPHGEPCELFMYAGMGNASTFMVETLFFWALFSVVTDRLHSKGAVTAFGDDIVVSARVAANPCFPLFVEEAGVKLNRVKSVLSDGPGFREACGLACYYGIPLATLISIKGPFDNTDIGRINLAGLISRLAASDLPIHQEIAKRLYDRCDLPCVEWDRPLDGVECILSNRLPPRGNVRVTWDKGYQRGFIRVRTLRPKQRRYYFKDLANGLDLGVLRGQLKADTVHRKGVWRTVICIDQPHRINLRTRKVYLPW